MAEETQAKAPYQATLGTQERQGERSQGRCCTGIRHALGTATAPFIQDSASN